MALNGKARIYAGGITLPAFLKGAFMAPNDTVRPTKLCMQIIRQFEPWHRGTALTHPDRFKCVNVQWHHKKKPVMMAGRYIELVTKDVSGEVVFTTSAVL